MARAKATEQDPKPDEQDENNPPVTEETKPESEKDPDPAKQADPGLSAAQQVDRDRARPYVAEPEVVDLSGEGAEGQAYVAPAGDDDGDDEK